VALTATNSIGVQNAALHTNTSSVLTPTRHKY